MPILKSCENHNQFSIPVIGVDDKKRVVESDLFFINKLFQKLNEGFSPIVGICGSQRIGKSTVALWLCILMMGAYGKKFYPEKNTFYEPIKAIENLSDAMLEAWLIDEAGDLVNRREWFDQTHQALGSIINTQGYKTMLYVFISPFILDIDSALTKHFDFLIRVDGRGRFKIFQFMKKYDAMEMKYAVSRKFLDDVSLKKTDVDPEVWDRYSKFSKRQKEMLRIKRVDKLKRKDKVNISDDPIHRLRKFLRDGR